MCTYEHNVGTCVSTDVKLNMCHPINMQIRVMQTHQNNYIAKSTTICPEEDKEHTQTLKGQLQHDNWKQASEALFLSTLHVLNWSWYLFKTCDWSQLRYWGWHRRSNHLCHSVGALSRSPGGSSVSPTGDDSADRGWDGNWVKQDLWQQKWLLKHFTCSIMHTNI